MKRNSAERHDSAKNTPNYPLRRIVAGVGLLAVAFAGIKIVDTFSGPEFNGQHTEIIGAGDTIWEHASEVSGHDKVDMQYLVTKIKEKSPDLNDGTQPGDEIIVPNSVE